MKYDEQTDKQFYIIGLIVTGLFLIAGTIFYLKEDFLRNVMPPCIFHSITGFYCPGCGATRAVYSLLQGKLLSSLVYNAFIVYLVMVGGWFMISQSLQRISRGKLRIGMHFRPIYAYIGIGILLLNWIIKNFLLYFHIYRM